MSNDLSSQPRQATTPESVEAASPPDEPPPVSPRNTREGELTLDDRDTTAPTNELSSTMRPQLTRAAQIFQRRVLPFLLPPLLLLLITAIVVALGSGLLLLGASDIQVGPVLVAKAVVAAGLGVLLIGSGALWFAMRA